MREFYLSIYCPRSMSLNSTSVLYSFCDYLTGKISFADKSKTNFADYEYDYDGTRWGCLIAHDWSYIRILSTGKILNIENYHEFLEKHSYHRLLNCCWYSSEIKFKFDDDCEIVVPIKFFSIYN